MNVRVWAGLILIVSLVSLIAEEIAEFELNFSSREFHILQEQYTMISVSDLNYIYKEEAGAPALPFRMVSLLVPYDAVYAGVTYDATYETIATDILIMPQQPLVPTLPNFPVPQFVPPEQGIYYSDKSYPLSQVEFTSEQKISQYKTLFFLISPFRYLPRQGKLDLITEITVTVNLEKGELTGPVRWDDGNFKDLLLSEIINPQDLTEYSLRSPVDPDDIKYLIITSTALASYFQPLIDWKTQTGVPASVVTTEYIYSTYPGSNNQLMIKNCIQDYYLTKNTTWVLLGGDNTVVPDLDCYGNVNNGGTTDNYIPTDLFYACFDNQFNWNADGDGINGETNDNIDMGPEVILSRAPVRSNAHVTAFVNKTLQYEQNPPASNFASDMLISGVELWNTWGGRSDADWRCEKMWNDYIDPWWDGTHYRFYDTNTDFGGSSYDVTVSNLTNQINGGYNYIYMATHGNQILWSTETGSWYYSSNASVQTNQNLQGMIATMACITNAFDNSSGYGSDPCLSEAFIRNPNGGAVAYHGSSRYGWGYSSYSDNHGPSLQYSDYLYYYLFRGEPTDNKYKFGAVATLGKIHFIAASSSYGAMRWLQFALNTIGDPELDLLTADPAGITISAPSEIPINNSNPVTISTNVPAASICMNNNIDVYICGSCDASGNFTCTPSPAFADDILVTVTDHNRIYDSVIITVNTNLPSLDVSISSISEDMEPDTQLQTDFIITNNGEPGSTLDFEILMAGNPGRSIAGSTITCAETEYESGTSGMILHLILYNASIDNEWISGATLDFPSNVTVTTSTNFVGGSGGDLFTNNSTGNGALVSWYDGDGGGGEIYPGESASATVTINISTGFSGDMVLNWTMQGDIWGSQPHSISGSITLIQSGPTLHLTSPNGAEVWAIDEENLITWEHSGSLPNVKLQVSRNNGSSWSNIISSTINDGIHNWLVTGPDSDNCLIKVASLDNSVVDSSDGVFTIYQPVSWLFSDILSGHLEYNEQSLITLTLDNSGMDPGSYYANVIITSNAGDDVTIPVIMNINYQQLLQPEIMETDISSDGDNFIFTWQEVPGATAYNVYSSPDPYTEFPSGWTLEYAGPALSWSTPLTGARKFFKVTASN